MNKYLPEEYWSVIDQRTGKKIADCGNELDAQNLAQLHPHRTYIKNTNHLMGQVIDIEMPKALPTNEIVVNMDGGVGGSWKVEEPKKLKEGQLKLPESELEPLNLS